MKISVVMPVHNEQDYLPYSLASLKDMEINELVIVLDRCTDQSEHIVNNFSKYPNFPVRIFRKNLKKWKHIAEVWHYTISRATNKIVYPLGADVIADPSMFNLQPFNNPKVAVVTYRHYPYRLGTVHLREGWEILLSKTLDKLGKFKVTQFGVFGLRKTIFEELGGFHDVISPFNDYKQRVLKAGYTCLHNTSTSILHLRPEWDRQRQHSLGRARAIELHYSLWRVLVHSFLHLKPHVLTGYLDARRMKA